MPNDTLHTASIIGLAAINYAHQFRVWLEYRRPAVDDVPAETVCLSPTEHAALIADILRDGNTARLSLEVADVASVVGQRVTELAGGILRAGDPMQAIEFLGSVERVMQSCREVRR